MNLLSDAAASLGSAAEPPQLLSDVISADGRILHRILKPRKRGTSERREELSSGDLTVAAAM